MLYALDEYIKIIKAPFKIKLIERAMTELETYPVGGDPEYKMSREIKDTIRFAINVWLRLSSSNGFEDELGDALKIVN